MEKLFETWSIEREVVLVKVLKHSRQKVVEAWTDPNALAQWYGPPGLAIESQEADFREGGQWRVRHVRHVRGEGAALSQPQRFLKIVPNELIVVDYGTPDADDPDRFHMIINLDDQADGKTVLTMRQLHPSIARYNMHGLGGIDVYLGAMQLEVAGAGSPAALT